MIAALALGLGISIATLSVIGQTLFADLPYHEPSGLVFIENQRRGTADDPTYFTAKEYSLIRDATPSIEVTGVLETIVLPMSGANEPELLTVSWAFPNLFRILGASPALGRLFTSADGHFGDDDWIEPVPIIISYELWHSRFGGGSAVVKTTVRLGRRTAVILGVLPRGFQLLLPRAAKTGGRIDVFQAVQWNLAESESPDHWVRLLARVTPGASISQVQSALSAAASRWRGDIPHLAANDETIRVRPLHDAIVAPVKPTLVLLAVTVTFILIIASANVANLLLARENIRRSEMAVRSALGASRLRLFRQLTVEYGLLSLVGGGLGFVAACGFIRYLQVVRPAELPFELELPVDATSLTFVGLLCLAVTVAYGIMPALKHIPSTGHQSLRVRSATGTRGELRVQSMLSAVQIALSIALLAGTSLMARSVNELQQVPLGFQANNLLTVNTNSISSHDERLLRERDMLSAVRTLPGVQRAGLGFPLPLNGLYERAVEYARDEDADQRPRTAYFRTISPGYLEALGVTLMSGRHFTYDDYIGQIPVVIVDEEIARLTWPNTSPIGKRIRLLGSGLDSEFGYEIVGVTNFVPQWDHRDRQPTLYVPRSAYRSVELAIAIRTQVDPVSLIPAIREVLHRIDPEIPVDPVAMHDLVMASLAPTRLASNVITALGVLALLLAGIGVYGVTSYAVRQKTREIGIRIAFGAAMHQVLREAALKNTIVALAGVSGGAIGTFWIGRLLEEYLFGVTPLDPVSLSVTALSVGSVVTLSVVLPVSRAAKIDPAVTLRDE